MRGLRAIGALVALAAAGPGCATATRLHTRPEGATVWVNGELIGKTPAVYDNDPGLPRRYHVQLYKPGYEPLDFYLDAKMSWLWGYVGAVTLVPYLWAWSLGRDYVFALTPAVEPATGPERAPAPSPAPPGDGTPAPTGPPDEDAGRGPAPTP